MNVNASLTQLRYSYVLQKVASTFRWYVKVIIIFHVTTVSLKVTSRVQTEYSMEIEKLSKGRERIGLLRGRIKAFIDEERNSLKEERDEARKIGAEEREEENRLLIEAQKYKLKSEELEVTEIQLKLVQKEQEIKEKE